MSRELNALAPVPEPVKLVSGTFAQIEPLRSRQFFKLLRIVTHGALPNMRDFSIFNFASDTSPQEFAGRLISLLLMSIPDAEDETIEFIRSMCSPVGLIEGRRLNKADTERNDELTAQLDEDLDNPELDDMVTILEAVVRREAEDIQALGKRLAAMLKLAEKTGQIPPQSQTSPGSTSSAGSPEPSTSSPASTDGPTNTSPTSPSPESGRSSPPSENVASTSNGDANSG